MKMTPEQEVYIDKANDILLRYDYIKTGDEFEYWLFEGELIVVDDRKKRVFGILDDGYYFRNYEYIYEMFCERPKLFKKIGEVEFE